MAKFDKKRKKIVLNVQKMARTKLLKSKNGKKRKKKK